MLFEVTLILVVELPWTVGCLVVVGELVGGGDRYFLTSAGFLLTATDGEGVGLGSIEVSIIREFVGVGEFSVVGAGEGDEI